MPVRTCSQLNEGRLESYLVERRLPRSVAPVRITLLVLARFLPHVRVLVAVHQHRERICALHWRRLQWRRRLRANTRRKRCHGLRFRSWRRRGIRGRCLRVDLGLRAWLRWACFGRSGVEARVDVHLRSLVSAVAPQCLTTYSLVHARQRLATNPA